MYADRRVQNSESEGDGRSMRVRQTDSRESWRRRVTPTRVALSRRGLTTSQSVFLWHWPLDYLHRTCRTYFRKWNAALSASVAEYC